MALNQINSVINASEILILNMQMSILLSEVKLKSLNKYEWAAIAYWSFSLGYLWCKNSSLLKRFYGLKIIL